MPRDKRFNKEVRIEKTLEEIYVFKVSLNKNAWRRIRMSSLQTLQHLHSAIQDAYDFDDDHLFAFFMDGKAWSKNAYWDKRDGRNPSANQAILSKIGLEQGNKFLYLFDFGDEWRFDVQLEKVLVLDKPLKKAEIIEKKGEDPIQYPVLDDFESDDGASDENSVEMLKNTIATIKADSERWAAKREAVFWQEMHQPFHLRSFLERLTKEELITIRQNLEIKGISKLNKKQLIEVLEIEIVNSMKEVISYFDYNQYKILKNIVNRNGIGQIELIIEEIEFFRELGFIFSCTYNGKRVLVIPNELIFEFNDLDKNINLHKNIKRNTKWINITQGLLYFYGTLTANKLLEMVGKYTEAIEISEHQDFFRVLRNAQDYYGVIKNNIFSYSNYQVFDPEKLLEEHNIRSTLDYYPFSYEQVYKAGNAEYVDKNLAFKRLTKFIMENYEITLNEAENLVEDCVIAIKLDTPTQKILEWLQNYLEIDSFELLQKFTEQMVFLNNNTRQWVIKGYTPNEVFENEKANLQPLPNSKPKLIVDNNKRTKISRNDPCPCGSGKKYKKCCGKN